MLSSNVQTVLILHFVTDFATILHKGVRWRSGRASDSESRGPGFDPHRRHHVVSLSKTH